MTTNGIESRTVGYSPQNIAEVVNLDSDDTGPQRQQHGVCVYGRGVQIYRDAGWRGVLPLPPAAKSPPPKGYTGYDGSWPTTAQINEWVAGRPEDSNLMLRVEYGVIGIDVDAYNSKKGGQTLAEAERRWGPLPSTYRSSARSDDEVSGVRIFRVPEDVLFRSVIEFRDAGLGDIEIVQAHHRYITAWPSIHPKTGQQYCWYGPSGTPVPVDQVPRVDDIPVLPEAWVIGLAKDSVREEFFDGSAPNRPREADVAVDDHVYERLAHLTDNGAPDEVVDVRLRTALLDLTSRAGSRYDTTRDHVAALMRMHSFGRVGVPRALAELCSAYVLEVGDTRPREVAEGEFKRFTEGAALLIAATPPSDPWKTIGMTGPGSEVADQGHTDVAEEAPSWCPVDLTDLLSGAHKPLLPSLFERSDGQCLLYPGLVHSFHGESESGKSLIIQVECVRLINQGQKVLYVDFESDVASVAARLLDFGADRVAIAEHFCYVQPEVRPDSAEERRAWEQMLSSTYALAVIDGVTDALGVFRCSTVDNDDVARWIREVPKQIADCTGAAVVLIDHVTKDPSTRNRFAIGGQAKMAGLTGAAYTVDVAQPLGRGLRGEVVLRVAKDRPGHVRQHCVSFNKRERTQQAARIVVDSTVLPPRVTIEPPGVVRGEGSGTPKEFRPTNLMERVSQEIEQHPAGLTKTQAATNAGGKKKYALDAVEILLTEGYVKTEPGRNSRPVYTSVKPYREKDDPRSDWYPQPGERR